MWGYAKSSQNRLVRRTCAGAGRGHRAARTAADECPGAVRRRHAHPGRDRRAHPHARAGQRPAEGQHRQLGAHARQCAKLHRRGRAGGSCLSSAYRSYNEQTYLFNRKVSQCGGDEAAAARIVNRPGTSEHQLGLCADITDKFYEVKTKELEKTALYQWMYAHCQDYGFILRYPADKQDITGVMYEPWHFRYVGKEAAAYIMGNGLCLEEFLDLYK